MKNINNIISLLVLSISCWNTAFANSSNAINSKFYQEKNSENYLENRYTLSYKNYNENIFGNSGLNQPQFLFIKIDSQHGEINDLNNTFTSNSINITLGKKTRDEFYISTSVGLKNLKNQKSNLSNSQPNVGIDFKYNNRKNVEAGIKLSHEYLTYSDYVTSNSITPYITYNFTEKFSSYAKLDTSILSDQNKKYEYSIGSNYTLSDYLPWASIGFNVDYLRYQDDHESLYWSPNKVYTYGPNFSLATPIYKNIGINFYYAINRSKDYSIEKWNKSAEWTFGHAGSLGIGYKNQDYQIVGAVGRSNTSKILTTPEWINHNDNNIKKTDSLTLGFSAFF